MSSPKVPSLTAVGEFASNCQSYTRLEDTNRDLDQAMTLINEAVGAINVGRGGGPEVYEAADRARKAIDDLRNRVNMTRHRLAGGVTEFYHIYYPDA